MARQEKVIWDCRIAHLLESCTGNGTIERQADRGGSYGRAPKLSAITDSHFVLMTMRELES
jgi:hypothetical protein